LERRHVGGGTIGFNNKAWFDFIVSPHTEKAHVTERFRRLNLGHLEIEITIEDPDTFTKPWVTKRVAELAPNDEIQEYVCTENERDLRPGIVASRVSFSTSSREAIS
jgi:hypothetical protein